MELWLIEIIHNIDLLCNIAFWFVTLIVLMGYHKASTTQVSIGKRLKNIWLISFLGILFIPSKEALIKLIL